jgi:hypothetical protein
MRPDRHSPLVFRLLAVATVALVIAAGTSLVLLHGASRPASSNAIQGPTVAAATVTAAAGRAITCPQGAEPGIMITNAHFSPQLAGGTTFLHGSYRVTLTGVVANETTRSIRVDGIDPVAQGAAWNPDRVTAPKSLAANSSGKLLIRGTYSSSTRAQVKVGASLRWRWSDPALVPCGSRGLIEDS